MSLRVTMATAPCAGGGSCAASSGFARAGRASCGGLPVWSTVGRREAVTAIRRTMLVRRISH